LSDQGIVKGKKSPKNLTLEDVVVIAGLFVNIVSEALLLRKVFGIVVWIVLCA
jgi:hypothetical protein